MEYGPVSADRYQEVIEHLREHFPDEPLNECVGLCKKNVPCELLEHHELHTLEEGLSIMAFDAQTGEIAGVALNGVSKPGDDAKALAEMDHIDSVQYRRIFGLLHRTNNDIDLFRTYSVDSIFELRILSVNSKFRGRGIAKQLFARSERLAEASGYKLIKVDATSSFSQRVADSLGMKAAAVIRYADVQDDAGVHIYHIAPPHDFYKVMVKQLGMDES